MESKPRAWEGPKLSAYTKTECFPIASGKILVECDRRDVLLRWTEDTALATNHRDNKGRIYRGASESAEEDAYIATPVASLLQSEAEKAWEEYQRECERDQKSILGDDKFLVYKQAFMCGYTRAVVAGEIGRKGE